MKKILLAIALILPLGAHAEESLESVKALHMKNCLGNGGLKEICSCSFDEALQLMSLKDLEKYNQMVEAGYNADIKTTGRLTRATMVCNQKLRSNEDYQNQAAQDQGLLPPPPPPPISGSVTNKPEPLPKASDVNTQGIQEKNYLNDAKTQAQSSKTPIVPADATKDPTENVAPVKPVQAKTPVKKTGTSRAVKPRVTSGTHYFGEYDKMYFESARKGDLEGLRAYAEMIPDPNVENESGDTALIVAARFGQMVSLKYLLANGADPNIANPKGQTALHVATYAKRIDMVDILLKAGANPNASYSKGFTPLMLAVMQQDNALVKTLIARNASVNMSRDDGNNELHIAVTGSNMDIVNQLIKAGVDKNKLNKAGNTPLMVAAYSGNIRAVKTLLNVGADVNVTDQYGRTALSLASNAGKADVAALLMSHQGKTRYHY
jgi:ankyrin repeat protein